jgi:hypothetical protein
MTTDRGITAAQNYAAVMARPGGEVAAGDGLRAFGAPLILPVQVHHRSGKKSVLQWISLRVSLAWVLPLDEKQKPQVNHP